MSALPLACCVSWLLAGQAVAVNEPGDAVKKSEIVIAPYLWAPDLKGSVGFGSQSVPLNVSARDLANGVNAAAMGYLQFNRDQHFQYFEAFGIRFSDHQFPQLGGQRVDAKLTLLETGYGRHYSFRTAFPVQGTTVISPYIGARYADLHAAVSNSEGSQKAGNKWVDPALGLFIEGPLYKRLSYAHKLDGAGFGLGKDHYWSSTSVLRLHLSSAWSVAAGYRISRFKAKPEGDGGLTLNLRGSGPDFGLSYAFRY